MRKPDGQAGADPDEVAFCRRQWQSIQYLRGFAALLVVFHHARNKEPWLYNPLEWFAAGSHGVDVFFVISGFVMYTAARHERVPVFYARRLARVAPLYWLATLASSALGVVTSGNGVSRLNLLRSLLFIPFSNPTYNGQIWPLLVPGWTLNFEMFFYVLFGVALALKRPLLLGWLVIPALVALGGLLPLPGAAWQIYTSLSLLEFAAGLAIGRLALNVDLTRVTALLPLGVVVLLLSDRSTLPPIVMLGGAAVAIVVGALGLEMAGRLPTSRAARRLGDASYSLYLVHPLVIGPVGLVWRRLPLTGPLQFVLFMVVAITLSLVAGFAVHFLLERPLLGWLNRGLKIVAAKRGDEVGAPTKKIAASEAHGTGLG